MSQTLQQLQTEQTNIANKLLRLQQNFELLNDATKTQNDMHNEKIKHIQELSIYCTKEYKLLLDKSNKIANDITNFKGISNEKKHVSFMIWNAGRLIKKNIKNIGDLKNITKYMKIKADFYCFQEMDPTLNYDNCKEFGYECFKIDYNFKNGIRSASNIILIDANKFEIIGRFSETEAEMIVEDPKIPNQKFVRFGMVIVKDRNTGDIFNIVNVHLKGGPVGYVTKEKLLSRMINFIDSKAKSGYTILGGDFNINFTEQKKRGDYGYNLLIQNNYVEDCDLNTLKRVVNGTRSVIPNIKYDYVFYKSKSFEGQPLKLIKCEVVTPEKPKPENFDHYPKINTFEFDAGKISDTVIQNELNREKEQLNNNLEFQELLNEIELTPKDSIEPQNENSSNSFTPPSSKIEAENDINMTGGAKGVYYVKYAKYKTMYLQLKKTKSRK